MAASSSSVPAAKRKREYAASFGSQSPRARAKCLKTEHRSAISASSCDQLSGLRVNDSDPDFVPLAACCDGLLGKGNESHAPLVRREPKDSLLWTVGDYTVGRRLGRGLHGQVFEGVHAKGGPKVAIKVVEKSDATGYQRCLNECAILRDLQSGKGHKHICALADAIENDKRLALLLQFAERGDLSEYVHARRRRAASSRNAGLSEDTARRFFKQLLSAVHYVHLKGYVHRDIKPSNILVTKDRKLLLCDFSLSATWSPLVQSTVSCGSLHFAAPEILSGKPYVGPEIDVYSCGAVLYFMLTGDQPFEALHDFDVLCSIKRGEKRPFKKRVSQEARNLVNWMMQVDPIKRASILDILTHPWLQEKSPSRKRLFASCPTGSGIFIGRSVTTTAVCGEKSPKQRERGKRNSSPLRSDVNRTLRRTKRAQTTIGAEKPIEAATPSSAPASPQQRKCKEKRKRLLGDARAAAKTPKTNLFSIQE